MPFELTINEALKIQRAQMVWYRSMIGRHGCREITLRTKLNLACKDVPNADAPISAITVNGLVPRGGSFERYLTGRHHQDDTTGPTHDAIRRGLL